MTMSWSSRAIDAFDKSITGTAAPADWISSPIKSRKSYMTLYNPKEYQKIPKDSKNPRN